eukprot:c10974_g1_i1.p1 GENE.c10974_g1_i1~~c10974_g1_i1.p1  ORF type:complete len:580 (+),score=142.14 c10974_g1_i1:206-1945(+)
MVLALRLCVVSLLWIVSLMDSSSALVLPDMQVAQSLECCVLTSPSVSLSQKCDIMVNLLCDTTANLELAACQTAVTLCSYPSSVNTNELRNTYLTPNTTLVNSTMRVLLNVLYQTNFYQYGELACNKHVYIGAANVNSTECNNFLTSTMSCCARTDTAPSTLCSSIASLCSNSVSCDSNITSVASVCNRDTQENTIWATANEVFGMYFDKYRQTITRTACDLSGIPTNFTNAETCYLAPSQTRSSSPSPSHSPSASPLVSPSQGVSSSKHGTNQTVVIVVVVFVVTCSLLACSLLVAFNFRAISRRFGKRPNQVVPVTTGKAIDSHHKGSITTSTVTLQTTTTTIEPHSLATTAPLDFGMTRAYSNKTTKSTSLKPAAGKALWSPNAEGPDDDVIDLDDTPEELPLPRTITAPSPVLVTGFPKPHLDHKAKSFGGHNSTHDDQASMISMHTGPLQTAQHGWDRQNTFPSNTFAPQPTLSHQGSFQSQAASLHDQYPWPPPPSNHMPRVSAGSPFDTQLPYDPYGPNPYPVPAYSRSPSPSPVPMHGQPYPQYPPPPPQQMHPQQQYQQQQYQQQQYQQQ